MDSNKEVKRLMDEWNLSKNQAKLVSTTGFENENWDGRKFYDR